MQLKGRTKYVVKTTILDQSLEPLAFSARFGWRG